MPSSLVAVIHINIDPVLFQMGGLSIHWYGVMYVLAFVAGYRFGVLPFLATRSVSRHDADRILTWAILAGLLGARLYFDVQSDFWVKLAHPIDLIAVWQGGMAFFGAIAAGAVTLVVLAIRMRKPFWVMWDAAALFAVIGQPIGRIGNVINGDILGSPSNLPWATAYDNPHAVLQSCCLPNVAYQPAAVYEALGTIAIGLCLLYLLKRGVRSGTLGITYLGGYAISQFLIFFLRNSEPVLAFGLKQAQFTAIVVFVVAVPGLVLLRRRFPTLGERSATLAA